MHSIALWPYRPQFRAPDRCYADIAQKRINNFLLTRTPAAALDAMSFASMSWNLISMWFLWISAESPPLQRRSRPACTATYWRPYRCHDRPSGARHASDQTGCQINGSKMPWLPPLALHVASPGTSKIIGRIASTHIVAISNIRNQTYNQAFCCYKQ